jgi:hypothetical protein
MGKLKSVIMEAQEFACDHYNIPRNQFIVLARDFAKGNSLIHQAAIEYYDEIQRDMDLYDVA